MNDQIEMADFVLVVCTKTYENRFKGRGEPGKGLGAKWEGAIITQEIYEANSENTRFIPVIFSSEDLAYIPIVLRSATHYNPTTKDYESLYRHLTNQPYTTKPELGEIQPMPPRARKKQKQKSNEYHQIKKLYADKERRQIIADNIVTEHGIELTDIDQSSANEQKVATDLKAKKVIIKRVTQK